VGLTVHTSKVKGESGELGRFRWDGRFEDSVKNFVSQQGIRVSLWAWING
jgi:hypothetical protein